MQFLKHSKTRAVRVAGFNRELMNLSNIFLIFCCLCRLGRRCKPWRRFCAIKWIGIYTSTDWGSRPVTYVWGLHLLNGWRAALPRYILSILRYINLKCLKSQDFQVTQESLQPIIRILIGMLMLVCLCQLILLQRIDETSSLSLLPTTDLTRIMQMS